MAFLKKKQIETVRFLYIKKQYSAREIAEYLQCSIDAVYYAMRSNDITRRNAAANSKIQFENKPLSYQLKKLTTEKERSLKLAGTMLYWAEGYKTSKSNGIDFANSDPHMQKIFIKFLRSVCGVDEKRIRIYLYTHDTSKQLEQIKYWSNILQVSTSQFTKPYVKQGVRLDKNDKMPYGLVHIRYADKKLLRQILVWIDEYIKI